MTDPQVKTPPNPRVKKDWIDAKLTSTVATASYKCVYSTDGPDTLNTLAAKYSGMRVGAASSSGGTETHQKILDNLTWRGLAQLNYGTDDPGEINWYLREFNGCTSVDQNGNYLLTTADANPFIYLPVISITTPIAVNVPTTGAVKINLPPPHTELSQVAVRRFNDIDVLKTGYLRRGDIKACLNGSSFSGIDGAMLATMFVKYSDMEDFSDDEFGPEMNGITRADIAAFDRIMTSDATPKAGAVQATYDEAKGKINTVGRDLFATSAIDPLMVCQGYVGDCWFLAGIVALKDRADAFVRAAIKTNGDAFTVKFNGASSPIQVPRPSDSQIAIVATTRGNGLWLTVLELAYGWQNDSFHPIDGIDSAALGGGKGIELMTGGSTTEDTLGLTRDSVTRDKLEHAFVGKKAVTTSVRGTFIGDSLNGWPSGHCYSVLSYDRPSDKIRIRNPWGNALSGQEMAFSDYIKTWTWICYED